jgi:hypothetical protein
MTVEALRACALGVGGGALARDASVAGLQAEKRSAVRRAKARRVRRLTGGCVSYPRRAPGVDPHRTGAIPREGELGEAVAAARD